MKNPITITIEKQNFIDHIKRICRSNTKRPCKICTVCPFKKSILHIMDENKWKYHESLNN